LFLFNVQVTNDSDHGSPADNLRDSVVATTEEPYFAELGRPTRWSGPFHVIKSVPVGVKGQIVGRQGHMNDGLLSPSNE
jgi:hypothetical protein